MARKQPKTKSRELAIRAAQEHVMQLERALADAKRRLFELQMEAHREGMTSDEIREQIMHIVSTRGRLDAA